MVIVLVNFDHITHLPLVNSQGKSKSNQYVVSIITPYSYHASDIGMTSLDYVETDVFRVFGRQVCCVDISATCLLTPAMIRLEL